MRLGSRVSSCSCSGSIRKIAKWSKSNKILDEKEGLEAGKQGAFERNEVLEKAAADDQVRIKELQKQIEQLKNIESIIKNRER